MDGIFRFLERNVDCSFVALDGAELVGTILCGHDGRRGLIHHFVVAAPWQRRGLGRRLVERGLSALRTQGIQKCHLLVFFRDNAAGRAFWEGLHAEERSTLVMFSIATDVVLF